jgi:hypothetical protein
MPDDGGGGEGNREQGDAVGGGAARESSGKAAGRPCPSGCGFVLTWHKTHCCSRCKTTPGKHGPWCNRAIGEAESENSSAKPMQALPSELEPTVQGPHRAAIVAESAAVAGSAEEASPTGAPRKGDGWYPGKHIHMAVKRLSERLTEVQAAKSAGHFQMARHPLRAVLNVALKQKRPLRARAEGGEAIGMLYVTVLGGKFRTKRAYVLAELDGNEQRSPTALSDEPAWEADMGASASLTPALNPHPRA